MSYLMFHYAVMKSELRSDEEIVSEIYLFWIVLQFTELKVGTKNIVVILWKCNYYCKQSMTC